ncbi:copia protein [Tanacetum coccineum]
MFVNTSKQRGFFTAKGRGIGIFVKEKGLSMDDGHDFGNGGEASGFVTSNVAGNGVDVHLPKEPVSVVNERLNSIVYGFFLGKRMAYRVVENYVKITWGKFGLVKSMMIKDMHFFKFNSKEGMEAMLESGPWLIRNVSLTLKQWTLDANIIKDDVCNIPVWVKFHVVPITAFTKDGLSAIATKLGSPLMLYYYTNLLFSGEGFTTSTIYVEYEWTPPRFSECKNTKMPCQPARRPPVGLKPKSTFVYRPVSTKKVAKANRNPTVQMANKATTPFVHTICYGCVWDNTSTQEANSVKAGHDNLHDVNDGESPRGNRVDVVVPVESIRAISEQFANTAYGFFWKAGGLSRYGLDEVIESGTWFIRNNPLILKKWNPYVELMKEDVGNVSVWVKLHRVPVTAFSEDGLSAIATKSRYARALIEVRVDVELNDNIMVAMPKLIGEGFYTCIVHVEYEWKPPRCACCKVFGHVQDECPKIIDSDVVKNMKKPSQATRGVLVGPKDECPKIIDSDVVKNMKKPSQATRGVPVGHKGKPLIKVDSLGDHDSEDEVTSVDNDMANFLALKKVRYGTNSLLEQWKESYMNGD